MGDDCSVEKVGKKACKNCSCGRVELEEKKVSSVLTASQINNPQSACGNVISFHIFHFYFTFSLQFILIFLNPIVWNGRK